MTRKLGESHLANEGDRSANLRAIVASGPTRWLPALIEIHSLGVGQPAQDVFGPPSNRWRTTETGTCRKTSPLISGASFEPCNTARHWSAMHRLSKTIKVRMLTEVFLLAMPSPLMATCPGVTHVCVPQSHTLTNTISSSVRL